MFNWKNQKSLTYYSINDNHDSLINESLTILTLVAFIIFQLFFSK